ncbi:SDR family oxidoreductase [Nocardioides ginsengisoli]|uniref:SDR family oxidoreductase n=1 Tax=Nocardioides ginsengisoli TaxID=363868 RepID=UPI00349EB13D
MRELLHYAPGYLDQQMGRIPMGRAGDPRELAAVAVFLASSGAGYLGGQTVVVDGGRTFG